MRHRFRLGGIERRVTVLLVGDRVAGAHVLLDQGAHLALERGDVRQLEIARLLGGFLGELNDRLDHRLEVTVAEHHGGQHDVLGQFLGFRFDHQHRIAGAGDHEVELAFRHLVDLGIEHELIVEEADALTSAAVLLVDRQRMQ